MVTTAEDWTPRLWDTNTKKRLAVLYHDHDVLSSAISDNYIVTVSQYSQAYYGMSDIRICRNSEGYQLVKVLRARERIVYSLMLDKDRILCQTRGADDEYLRPLVHNSLVVVDIATERAYSEN